MYKRLFINFGGKFFKKFQSISIQILNSQKIDIFQRTFKKDIFKKGLNLRKI